MTSESSRYRTLDDCMSIWESDTCGSCERKWYACNCLQSEGETIEVPDDGEISLQELTDRYAYFKWSEAPETPEELYPEIPAEKNFDMDTKFSIKVECSECEAAEVYEADLAIIDLGTAQERARTRFRKLGWRRVVDPETGLCDNYCPACLAKTYGGIE